MPPTEVKTFVEERERVTLCLLVGLVFVHHSLDLGRKKTTDRRVSPRSQDLRLTDGLPVEADRHILLHVNYV